MTNLSEKIETRGNGRRLAFRAFSRFVLKPKVFLSFLLIVSIITGLLTMGYLEQKKQAMAASSTWDLSSASDYTYDSSKIEVTGGVAQLKTQYTPGTNWINTAGGYDWYYRQKITIDHTKVYTADQSDFPVLIKITANDNAVFTKAQSDGDDLVFTSSNGATKIDHEIEKFVTADGSRELDAWVRISSLSTSVDTEIYLYYGNSHCASQQNQAGVWNSAYVGVWHLKEGAGVLYDSTGNDNDLTQSGGVTYSVSGIVNSAAGFGGDDEYLYASHSASLAISGQQSVQLWVKASSLVGDDGGLISKSGDANKYFNESAKVYELGILNNTLYYQISNGATAAVSGSVTSIINNNWHLVSATWDGTTGANGLKIYFDSTMKYQNTSGINSIRTTTSQLDIGGYTTDWNYSGSIDEVRISNTNRDINWITTEYNNLNSPDTFSSPGPEISLYPSTNPTITLVEGQGYATASAFSETAGAGSSGTIKYQISPNGGSTWYFWNSVAWASTSSGYTESNTASDINSHIAAFTAGSVPKTFIWRAYLNSDGSQQPKIDAIALTYIWDTLPPTLSSILAKNESGGSVNLIDNSWYNYGAPYFEWTYTDHAGVGEQVSGVAGYFVSYGIDSGADPQTEGSWQVGNNYTVSSAMSNNTTYYLRVRALDEANNLSAAETLFTYKYDNEDPVSPEYINVSPVGCSTATNFTFSWPAGSDAVSGIAGYDYKLGASGTVLFLADLTINLPPYQDSDNVFYVRSHDIAGNVSGWQTAVFCATGIVNILEVPSVVAGPSSIRVTWSSSKATTSYVQVYEGNSYISEQGHTSYSATHDVTVVGLKPERVYRYKLMWSDASGNLGESDWFETNTTSAPSVNSLTTQIISPTQVIVSFETSIPAVCMIEYGIGNYDKIIEMNGAGSEFSKQFTGLAGGTTYQIRVKATSSDGFEFYAGDSFSTPPLPSISGIRFEPDTSEANSAMKVSWSTNVETSSSVFYGSSGQSKKEISTSDMVLDHSLTITDLQDDTDYEVYASGRDQFGNTALSAINSFKTALDTRPPKISDLTIEAQTGGTTDPGKAQIVVSWRTDEPASSQVEFGEGSSSTNYSSKTQEDLSYANAHVVVISNLDASKTYHLRAVSKDRAGNAGTSEDNAIITRKAKTSALDLIIQAFQKAFSWLKIFQ